MGKIGVDRPRDRKDESSDGTEYRRDAVNADRFVELLGIAAIVGLVAMAYLYYQLDDNDSLKGGAFDQAGTSRSSHAPTRDIARAPREQPIQKPSPRNESIENESSVSDSFDDQSAPLIPEDATCTEVTAKATRNPAWKRDLDLGVPQRELDGYIKQYQIQWFNGSWSKPYFPGDDDIDWKKNGTKPRRVWSYFFDHNHRYILCK